MINAALRAAWDEPAEVAAPGTTRWDRALVAALVPVAVLETWWRPDVVWPLWNLGWALVVVLTLLWRPHRPLAMLLVGYGAQTVAGVVPALAGEPYSVLDVTAVILLLAYSLGRWASGRGVVVGTAAMLLMHLAREPLYDESAASIGLGVGALLLPVAVGAAVRFLVRARRRERDEVRMRERQRLARDLHDTVAHHVSGILMQARAARVVARTDPAAAVGAIEGVEAAAARSLEDMRAIVAVLRDERDGPAERSPSFGLADVPRLADGRADGVPTVVTTSGELEDVDAPVGAAVYRVAQEAVTNAYRHAHGATAVTVEVATDGDHVRLRVHDDGRAAPGGHGRSRGRTGYGLVGMRERVALLGGTLSAGPDPVGGWTVEAVVPAAVPAPAVQP